MLTTEQQTERRLLWSGSKTVAIVGSHTLTRGNAPWDDPDIDIWVFNEAAATGTRDEHGVMHPWAKRVTGVFQMHSATIYRNPDNRSDPEHWRWLQMDHEYPIWMQEIDPDVPASVRYPLERVLGLVDNVTLHGVGLRYLTSTIAAAFALALVDGYSRILLYGVEMSSETEYVYQRDCVAFWVGVAAGLGVKVELCCAGDVFDRLLYGYESDIYQNPDDLNARVEELQAQVKQLRDDNQEAARVWAEALDRVEFPAEKLEACLNAATELGRVEGALAEAKRYAYKAAQMIAETGKAHIDRTEFEIAARLERQTAEDHRNAIHRTAGRIDLIVKGWIESRNPDLIVSLKRFADDHVREGYDSGFYLGKSEENYRLMADIDKRIRAAGGSKAVELLV